MISFRKYYFLLFLITNLLANVTENRKNAITKSVKKMGPTVASINVVKIKEFSNQYYFNDPFFRYLYPTMIKKIPSLGSGVIISPDGYILTNQHVIENSIEIIITLSGGKQYDAEIIGEDRKSDLALLKIDDSELPFAKFADSNEILIGEWVIALGNPFGLFALNNQPTVTVGVISSKNLNFGTLLDGREYKNMIQTDASINSGNSGGPLCNADGEVVGINTFIYSGENNDQGSIGIGFAIPINRAIKIAEELKKYGRMEF